MADRAGMPTIRGAKRRVARLTAICSLLVLLSSAFGVRGASASPGAAMGSRAAPTSVDVPSFPADNVWNADVSGLPVASDSGAIVASIGAGGHLHPDFGAGLYQGEPIGIPYVVVPSTQSAVPMSFQYADESDAGPYPIPANAPIEGGAASSGDRHVIVVQSGTCKLYETFASYPQGDGSWKAGSGATWSLTSDALRPAGWTSADAAGLPILPGLVRYDEVAAGAIDHAIRFTVSATRDTYVWPGRHEASAQTSASLPPMGLRLRLKSGVDISGFSAANRVILTALKRYGHDRGGQRQQLVSLRRARRPLEQRRSACARRHPRLGLRGGGYVVAGDIDELGPGARRRHVSSDGDRRGDAWERACGHCGDTDAERCGYPDAGIAGATNRASGVVTASRWVGPGAAGAVGAVRRWGGADGLALPPSAEMR